MTKRDILEVIESFLNDTAGEWDWDDFTSVKLKDPELEIIRLRCANLPFEFPPSNPSHYCSEEGFEELRKIAEQLKKESGQQEA